MSSRVDEVILRIRCDDAIAASVTALVDPIIGAHSAVAQWGGFSNPDRTGRLAELTLTSDGSASDRRYAVQARFVDRGAWRVLLDAVRGELWLKELTAQADVQCSVITAEGDVLGTQDLESVPYPTSARQTPFQLSWSEDGPPLHAAVRVFLRDIPSATTVEEIGRFLLAWQRLLRGYRPPPGAETPYGGAIPTEALWAQPYAVEIGLDAFVADESAFHPIVNFACWLRERDVVIEELVIE